MRLRISIAPFAAIALAGSLSACADMAGLSMTPSSSGTRAEATSYGDYMSAGLAAAQHDLSDAAKLYRESLSENPSDPDILNHAFFYTVANGDVDDATRLIGEQRVALSPRPQAQEFLVPPDGLVRNPQRRGLPPGDLALVGRARPAPPAECRREYRRPGKALVRPENPVHPQQPGDVLPSPQARVAEGSSCVLRNGASTPHDVDHSEHCA